MPRFYPVFANFFKGKDVSKYLSPPYDVIDEDERKALEKKSPSNVVRLILPQSYQEVRDLFLMWIRKGIIYSYPESGYFYLEADVEDPIYGESKLKGIFGRMKVEKFGKGIFPHEKTFSGPKKDRYELMRNSGVAFSHVVGIYDGPEFDEVLKEESLSEAVEVFRFSSAGMKGKVYFLGISRKIYEAVLSSRVLIADGHHRYETFLALSRDFPHIPEFSYANFFLTSKRGGLNLHPTHRAGKTSKLDKIEKILSAKFHIEKLPGEKAMSMSLQENEFVLIVREGAYLLRYRGDFSGVPTQISDPYIMTPLKAESVCYSPFFDKLFTAVLEGKVDFALRIPEFSIERIFEQVEKGKRLPQKTTYFFPKIPSGLLMYRFF